ncbi:MAG: pentapeptide repeat-containing protein [Candidatus Dadabacteria bacterium]|nr:pentapeptide repeat-containing protein [Candidatus Dadabacteria bacterium]NIS07476.1 pentapeptide repeat-containing protein [Candidatus Dadabacteria bacterium]NIV41782.1 hypothetical protein [Candidatus Dadabacteria bacterium]NIY21115.1 hypothetical protein [Candidatus Dadabacteria bacterium]
MSNETHLEILKKGAEKWNEWREENPGVIPDFSWANMPEMELSGYNLEDANLKLAFCKGCNFAGSNFKNSYLYGANLESTDCSGCDFSGSNLEGALIKDANLKDTNLSNCNFRLANLEGSDFGGADFSGSKKLKADQLSRVSNILGAKIAQRLKEKLSETSPHLLTKSLKL